MELQDILDKLKSLADPHTVVRMVRYGINPESAYGVSIPNLRKIARQVGKNHALAEQLWSSGIHEARILASMVDDPNKVTEEQMEQWAADFNSWDLCDQCCNNLLRKYPGAHFKAMQWTRRNEEFIKRAGFVLMACLAVHDKKAANDDFLKFLPVIEREAVDERNFVKKAANWALRQIGKRDRSLNREAVASAERIGKTDSKSAKWIAANALRELTGPRVQERLGA